MLAAMLSSTSTIIQIFWPPCFQCIVNFCRLTSSEFGSTGIHIPPLLLAEPERYFCPNFTLSLKLPSTDHHRTFGSLKCTTMVQTVGFRSAYQVRWNTKCWKSCSMPTSVDWEGEIKLTICRRSGDFDGRVPTTGTREWIAKLGLAVRKPWYPWVHGGPRETKTGGGQVPFKP